MPKELMLFVKNLVFLDGAVATLAPNLDLLAEIGEVAMHFATTHGERLASQLGIDVSGFELDLEGVKAGLGLDEQDGTTYRDLQERRDLIRNRLQKKGR
jgi:ubiquinone biosynthesis protein